MGAPALTIADQRYSGRGLEAGIRYTLLDCTRLTFIYTYLGPEWDECVVSSFGGPLDFSGATL